MGLSRVLAGLASLLGGLGVGEALADQPRPWQLDFQPAATSVMERVEEFHTLLVCIIIAIVVLVLALLIYVIARFNERANPSPSKTHHNAVLEVIWTAVPILILAVIVVPSLKLLYYQAEIPKSDMTIKVTGHQWYWTYTYPDDGNFSFDAYLVADKDLKPGQLRLLTTDNPIVVPIGATVRVQITSTDVIHSWSVPSFGIKTDAVPGRLNETWFKVDRPGTYYGQCDQLCGNGHGFMPIMVEAVSKQDFDGWVAGAKKKFAGAGEAGSTTQVAVLPAN